MTSSLAILLLLISSYTAPGEVAEPRQPKDFVFSEGWTFRQAGSTQWRDAKVPGSVQEDLIHHQLLGDPRIANNEKEGEWVEAVEWEYQRPISVHELPNKENITLRFEGLDTYASVMLNDSLLLEANNMFRLWEISLQKSDFKENNTLKIVFHSAVAKGQEAVDKLGYILPSPNDAGGKKVSSFVRKAPYQFGWDWAPRSVTCGIWKTPKLIGWDDLRVLDLRVVHDSITDEMGYAHVEISVESDVEELAAVDVETEGRTFSVSAKVKPGKNTIQLAFKIAQPELWWPNGWGKARLYQLHATVKTKSVPVYAATKRFGFRTIELKQEADELGTSFEFWVNGKALFVKGANYVPQSVFPASVKSREYEQLLGDVKAANFNMLRVWGGGVYENDRFYELCDSLGILVWQDFMFACAMYPFDANYLQNVSAEAHEQVARLSDHPSVAMWCGNNEVNVAWGNWGWQKEFSYSKKQQKAIQQGYADLFQLTLPEAVQDNALGTPYVHTSPLSNWGKEENFNHHNMHYWGVWHGPDDFEGMERNVPRFMSEYGFQSFPAPSAFEGQLEGIYRKLDDPYLQARQKSYKTTKELLRHLEQHYPNSKDYASFAYLSQLNQRLAMRMAIHAHRKDRKRCSGTLYWQLNDVWAGPTWSTIDFAGNWKAAHYMVRDRYKAVIAIPQLVEEQVELTVANDQLKAIQLKAEIICLNFNGDTLSQRFESVEVPANASQKIGSWPIASFLPEKINKEKAVLLIRLYQGFELVDELPFYLAEPKDLALLQQEYETAFRYENGQATVTLSATTLLKDVFLDFGVPGTWNKNYQDVLPGTQIDFVFTPSKGEVGQKQLKIVTLNRLLPK